MCGGLFCVFLFAVRGNLRLAFSAVFSVKISKCTAFSGIFVQNAENEFSAAPFVHKIHKSY